LKDWWFAGFRLSLILTFHRRLMEAVESGSTEPVRSLSIADSIPSEHSVTGKPFTDEEYLMVASMVLANLINERLADCREGIAAACGFEGEGGGPLGGPGVFMHDILPPNLEAAAYSHLAQLVVARAELRECPGCGRTFAPKSGKQKYCRESCASTSRARRFRQRQSGKA
jgi:hypothetical protein